MNLHKLILTENACYKAGRTIAVKGIMVHSTGANNPSLKRYVGPNDGLLGENKYNNHWNTDRPGGRQVCVHAFIGRLADGTVATYQTLPWNHRGWHAGGSANNTHIGFEICEDGLTDSTYFSKVYREAVELCAMLCKEYGLTEQDNEWSQHTLQRLLTNYSYTGNLMLQTTFIEDHITKKGRINQGQLPMYHAENSHEPIISMEEFQEALQVRKERAEIYRHEADYTIVYPFRGKLLCMDCGKHYRRKIVRRGPVWICATYNSKGKAFCPTSKAIPEETLMAVTARVLGSDRFDGDLFRERVERIEVGTENRLTYILADGTTVATVWQDRSRRESWTEDKREAARQATMKYEMPERDSYGKFKKSNRILPGGNGSTADAE